MSKKSIFKGLFVVFLSLSLVACAKNSNQTAEQNEEKGRYITVINKTGEVIKDLAILVDEGTEVTSETDPYSSDTDSISIEIPKDYEEHSEFTIVLTSRHDFVFEVKKTINDPNGRFEVTVKEGDKVKDGDWVDKFFNDNKE
ncbi:TPA: hypothetical protein ACGOWW_000662 [Streptococcus suis]|uniref:hypothetical protein n=1 Tax=Streptococcus suis TaxID=1307 RepID=UPI00241224D6|nr:hypothetical protein [Streptococcus suis]MDG4510362.1 hypothetical protein [Streptococcus suis]